MNGVEALQAYLDGAIPLVRAMQVEVREAGAERVVLAAPLAPNVNHQSTAFGGSVAGLATLACWGWLWTRVQGECADTQLVVARSEIDYLKPVTTDMTAMCAAPAAADEAVFLKTFARRGKARVELTATVLDAAGEVCARFTGTFVAIKN